jgi:zinc protease
LKQALETSLKGREANPTSLAFTNFTKLVYGDEHILGFPTNGTLETITDITLDDLKAYYDNNLSSSLASIHVVGFVDQGRVKNAFQGIDANWKSKEVEIPEYELPENTQAGKLYFIDVPDAKQSVIFLGRLALSGEDPDFNNLDYANEILGGGSSGKLFQTLRIEKGYTYGAYSSLRQYSEVSPFYAYSSVRANATKESMGIIIDMIKNYGPNYSENDVEVTKNKILKANTRKYESLNAKLGILRDLSKFDKSLNYLEEDQKELISLTLEDYKRVIDQHIKDDLMVYLVVGDKATQLSELNKLGLGEAIELDLKGNVIAEMPN